MPDPACPNCSTPFQPGDAYCAACGCPSARIDLSLSSDRSLVDGVVRLRPGGRFFLAARNTGFSAARVEVDPSRAQGVSVAGIPSRRVTPGQEQSFELVHEVEHPLGGALLVRSDDGPREHWWERRGWREKEIRLALHVRVREEAWVLGSPALLFPPGVRRQVARVWNDSDHERPFLTEAPAGYRVTSGETAVDQKPLPVPVGESIEVSLRHAGLPGESPDREWRAGPDGTPIPLIRMAPASGSGAPSGPDAVVAIDFGTRNTGIRVRWRRTLVPAKPAGTVDPVGDRGSTPRFPTQMVLHLQERSFRWGSEAAEYIAANRMTPDEIALDNLKTYLREGQEPLVHLRPDWTAEELLGRYFERIFHRLDEYFRTAQPDQPLSRANLEVRYVVCRPVLDANEGDEAGRRYEQALLRAMARCGVPEEAVSLIQEPIAAGIGIAANREEELLGLPDGAAVAVVDSGGGTTHVALARVRLAGGRVSLDLAGSYALRLGSENPAIEAIRALEKYGFEDRREVGGNVLDRALALELGTRAPKLLESDGRSVPNNLWRNPKAAEPPAPPGSLGARARVREILRLCQQMKERFARVSTQYLNRAPGEPRDPGETLPFPNREDLQGVYLVHALYDEVVLAPILDPVVGELAGRVSEAQAEEGVRPSEVRRVFFVGGTNVDPFVRRHFGRAFPLAAGENDPEAQSERRIAERLNAVVEGAAWFGEQLFALSPLTLSVRLRDREEVLVQEGAALPPAAVAGSRFLTGVVPPGQELDACLTASGGGLEAPLEVARGFYRNDSPDPQEVSLSLATSRDRGASAALHVGTRRIEQWRFLLVETER